MRAHVCRRLASFVGLLAVLLAPSPSARAYGILTHQQLVDQAWESTIVPILLNRFPSLTPEQLVRAHAYAYGGCVIQDLGYYPFSNAFFSDLTHYVRSGDFIRSLFRNAHNADQVAFAIGALTHYFGDSIGHANATNPSVAIAFPKLSGKFGPSVNYAQDKVAHSRVEFAFDISQAAKRRLAPYDYVVYVGLEVPWDQIAAAFHETYGFPIRDVLGHYGNTIRAYRFAARRFLPAVTYAEALIHRGGLPADTPGAEFDLHERRTAQLAREADWDRYRKAPGIGTHLLAGLVVILPKIGPLKMLAIKSPTLQTQSLYIESVNLATTALALSLQQLGTPDSPGAGLTDRRMAEIVRTRNTEVSSAIGADRVVLSPARTAVTLPEVLAPNRDLDTGQRVVPGGYSLTDETYVKLLGRVTKDPAQPIPDGLKQDIVHYYGDPDAPISTKRDAKKWGQVQHQLSVLKSMPVVPNSVPSESR